MEPEIELMDNRLVTMKAGIEETEREMASLLPADGCVNITTGSWISMKK